MSDISVQLVYPFPDRQTIIEIRLPAGSNVNDAISKSGILHIAPAVELDQCRLAVWGKFVEGGQTLRDRDRIEILRPLQVDPKTARRQRAGRDRQRD
ncbi:MAG: RnfH family protein [Burkholderiales bacterium]